MVIYSFTAIDNDVMETFPGVTHPLKMKTLVS